MGYRGWYCGSRGYVLYGTEAIDYLKKTFDPGAFYYILCNLYKEGKVYVGRTSGFGNPERIVRERDFNHHMNAKGYGKAQLSTAAQSAITLGYAFRLNDPAYWAIRGSEQLQIEVYRNIGISGNDRNGIGELNRKIDKYLEWGYKFLK